MTWEALCASHVFFALPFSVPCRCVADFAFSRRVRGERRVFALSGTLRGIRTERMKAGRFMTRRDKPRFGTLQAAYAVRVSAAGMKGASRRRIQRAWGIAGDA